MSSNGIEIPPETTFEFVLRIWLYLGAVFQFICIAAIIVMPEKSSKGAHGKNAELTDDEFWEGSSSVTPRHTSHRPPKKEKKKRR